MFEILHCIFKSSIYFWYFNFNVGFVDELLILHTTYNSFNSLNNKKIQSVKSRNMHLKCLKKSFFNIAPKFYFIRGTCQNYCWASWTYSFIYLNVFSDSYVATGLYPSVKLCHSVIARKKHSYNFSNKFVTLIYRWFETIDIS